MTDPTILNYWGYDDSAGEQNVVTSNAAFTTGRANVGQAIHSGASPLAATWYLAGPTTAVPMNQQFCWGSAMLFSFANANGSWGFQDSTGVTLFSFRRNANVGTDLQLINGAGAVLQTSVGVYRPGPAYWLYMEVKATITSTTTATIEVRFDGRVIMTYTGTITTGNGTVGRLTYTGSGQDILLDDAYFITTDGTAPFNTYLGDLAVRQLLPTGNGDSSQWTNSGGTSVNNYSYVDEVNSTMTDYVAAATAGLTDLYPITDVPLNYDVLAIQNLVMCAKTDAGTPPFAFSTVSKGLAGTVRSDSAKPLSTTPLVFVEEVYTTDPDGNPLSPTTVNGMQTGLATV